MGGVQNTNGPKRKVLLLGTVSCIAVDICTAVFAPSVFALVLHRNSQSHTGMGRCPAHDLGGGGAGGRRGGGGG